MRKAIFKKTILFLGAAIFVFQAFPVGIVEANYYRTPAIEMRDKKLGFLEVESSSQNNVIKNTEVKLYTPCVNEKEETPKENFAGVLQPSNTLIQMAHQPQEALSPILSVSCQKSDIQVSSLPEYERIAVAPVNIKRTVAKIKLVDVVKSTARNWQAEEEWGSGSKNDSWVGSQNNQGEKLSKAPILYKGYIGRHIALNAMHKVLLC